MATPRKKPEDKLKTGRPTKYIPELHPQLAEAWTSAGRTLEQLAEKLGVSLPTVKEWMRVHPEFSSALKRAREEPDDKVERSLFERATGYSFTDEKLMTVSDGQGMGSHVERFDVRGHCPPDPTSMIFWLKNRRPERWREKVEHTGPDGGPIEVAVIKRVVVDPNAGG